jgi:hypothetical protein
LEGNLLTQRVRVPLAGRDDLWLGAGIQPLLNVTSFHPIPLADGRSVVTRAQSGEDMEPFDNWLPGPRPMADMRPLRSDRS